MEMFKREPKMQEFIDNLSQKTFGNRITAGKCVSCNKDVNTDHDFKDMKSLQEYSISGLCQKCQDEMYICSHNIDLSEGRCITCEENGLA